MADRKSATSGNGTAEGATTGGASNTNGNKARATQSGPIAASGVQTGEDFARLMSALMSDVLDGSVSPMVANAAVNAGGKLLKVVEMQYRHGTQQTPRETVLVLAPPKGR